ncbi:hypothetical protein CIHG_00559 [Coccidioides immitis H538.4]|uniref:Uncharacterized protein n=2 Tax=Coccidioides immitis TaxID=5501 RepID=A0A0J8RD05_COCIT|nr:hypothetical protein CIRG_07370 [Coccidioides immitis RMSCC 2394]KMU82777.1 hypothetical protein CIHG_00559 [Coccidioides immitis H538.4]
MYRHKDEPSAPRASATAGEANIEPDMRFYRQSRTSSPCWNSKLGDTSDRKGRRSVSCEFQSSRASAPMSDRNTQLSRDQRFQGHSHSSLPSSKAKRSASHTSLRSEPLSAMRATSRSNHPLQLLSFESLGISNSSLAFTPSQPNDRNFYRPVTDASSSISSPLPSSSLCIKPDNPYRSPLPLTPPETEDNVLWNPNAHQLIQPSSHHSSPPSDEHDSGHYLEDLRAMESSESESNPEKNGQGASLPLQNARNMTTSMPVSNGNQYPEDNSDEWLQDAILPAGQYMPFKPGNALSSLPIPKSPGESVQLVSQTLPCPPSESSATASPRSAFTPIVKAIQSRLQPGNSPYINIVHAVPPMFNLSSLPTSPPSTPHLLFSGDDYFSNTVFSSAAVVPGYPTDQINSQPSGGHHHLSSPVVPPFSVHIAVIERYLPPSSIQEYQSLLLNKGPSVLLDRLLELSTNRGSLMFIYPTRRGAETFRDKYLSPILDPLLRQMAVVNGLSADVGNALGRIASIEYMDDFAGMKARLLALCDSLSSRNQSSSGLASRRTNFTLAYAGQTTVQVDRKLWTEWYIQQEAPRAKDILNRFWRKGHRMPDRALMNAAQRHPTSQEITGASLLREILDGIRHRAYPDGCEPDCGLELGVFVIRRSL